ncbi:MAG TPA: alpha/beta hydrolase [Candidatus Binataceae bacterium]|jgi:pimeloyl-ACP methyl ester carboxylesterase|nr:alpha/beta hydrolase [Candidatus Binataceae bacterium]
MPYADNRAVKIYYDCYGSGVPIVFLHPWTTNGNIWYYQVFNFAVTNRCVAIDHRGMGRSDKPASGYSIPEHAGDVAAVLDALKIDRAVLVGNSIGGMIALQFNLDYPDRVIGNVIVSSGTGLFEGLDDKALKEMAAAYESDYLGTFDTALQNSISARSKREKPEILEVMKAHMRIDAFPQHVFKSSFYDPNGLFRWNIGPRLREIRKPTVVFAGEEDFGILMDKNKFLADHIPGAKLTALKDIGHFYQLERPAEFNAELRKFLTSVGA